MRQSECGFRHAGDAGVLPIEKTLRPTLPHAWRPSNDVSDPRRGVLGTSKLRPCSATACSRRFRPWDTGGKGAVRWNTGNIFGVTSPIKASGWFLIELGVNHSQWRVAFRRHVFAGKVATGTPYNLAEGRRPGPSKVGKQKCSLR